MDLLNIKYIIMELIPTNKANGDIIELTALKLDGIKLIDRFNYRLNEDKVLLKDFIEMFSYDKESFTYLDTTEEILIEFKKWAANLPLLLIDNTYTLNYLSKFNNKKELVFKYLNLEPNENVFNEMIKKYNLQQSNYLVDLIYESLIKEL